MDTETGLQQHARNRCQLKRLYHATIFDLTSIRVMVITETRLVEPHEKDLLDREFTKTLRLIEDHDVDYYNCAKWKKEAITGAA
jgi:hypothetical protein